MCVCVCEYIYWGSFSLCVYSFVLLNLREFWILTTFYFLLSVYVCVFMCVRVCICVNVCVCECVCFMSRCVYCWYAIEFMSSYPRVIVCVCVCVCVVTDTFLKRSWLSLEFNPLSFVTYVTCKIRLIKSFVASDTFSQKRDELPVACREITVLNAPAIVCWHKISGHQQVCVWSNRPRYKCCNCSERKECGTDVKSYKRIARFKMECSIYLFQMLHKYRYLFRFFLGGFLLINFQSFTPSLKDQHNAHDIRNGLVF